MPEHTELHARLRDLLQTLENALKAARLWHTAAPTPEDLASTMPFMCDKMQAATWVRWVMVPRFWAILDLRAPLPARCDVREYVAFEWQDYLNGANELEKKLRSDILSILGEIDDCINGV